jgi:hypothetical protein
MKLLPNTVKELYALIQDRELLYTQVEQARHIVGFTLHFNGIVSRLIETDEVKAIADFLIEHRTAKLMAIETNLMERGVILIEKDNSD